MDRERIKESGKASLLPPHNIINPFCSIGLLSQRSRPMRILRALRSASALFAESAIVPPGPTIVGRAGFSYCPCQGPSMVGPGRCIVVARVTWPVPQGLENRQLYLVFAFIESSAVVIQGSADHHSSRWDNNFEKTFFFLFCFFLFPDFNLKF